MADKLRNINDVVAHIRKETQDSVKRAIGYWEQKEKDQILMVEQNYQCAANLDAAGVKFDVCGWPMGTAIIIDLGFFARTKPGSRALADAVRKVRLTLGCTVKPEGETVADSEDDKGKNNVVYTLKPVDYPGITVTYSRRLPKHAKCKIVTEKRTTRRLVCTGR